jgi:hypothetical protein
LGVPSRPGFAITRLLQQDLGGMALSGQDDRPLTGKIVAPIE